MGDRWLLPVDHMEPGGIDYAEIDAGVRDAVRALNRIPFVETVASCEGHVQRRHYGHPADPGFAFLHGGYLGMYVDEEDRRAAPFLRDMAGLARKYHFSDFGKVYHRRKAGQISGPYGLGTNTSAMSGRTFDLADQNRITEEDAEEARCKKARQAEISLVRGRKLEYQMLWADVAKVAALHASD